MNEPITSVADLEAVIGKTPLPMTLKVIDHLDEGALRWIRLSPLMVAAFGDGAVVAVTLAGGEAGFAAGSTRELRLPIALLDDPASARPGAAVGSLFPLPGVTETLRVNGRVTDVRNGEIHIAVEECFGHCGKALIRSDFWTAAPLAVPPADISAFVAECRFMALATIDAQGRADLSPKGDPAGMMAQLDGSRLWFADRPGNRRVDSFRNIITQPRVAAALLIPGSTHFLRLSGVARMTSDEAVRAQFRVQDKTPALATLIDDLSVTMSESSALVRARIWPVAGRPAGIEPAKIFAEHIKLNKAKGLGARLTSAALSVPGTTGLLQKVLEKEYKDNLY
ncbi:pyridoxamine 5'-phosphate oxidase family protein [Bradyrhizobium sp. LHD-71]|uniref:pyridoxamine 5'-phosphate oxidase family protein n=1 Tax=Bradyrhizobium sp. LHD-71 TaxID=3072141 RepID=UPI00280F3537|nr:pyridoxamine 5'-phosphate oxidase family protein [Bradyrhizobium sp. LHD-71]MDQ8730246.1 pyridoxamine 5'-phosphate oxidase family protein [Bradyrhizobium sp. LHD-71]